jgi:DNA polymerase/3'-5' exonuclease PolX
MTIALKADVVEDGVPGVFAEDEQQTVAAICDRVHKMIGVMDREGVLRDLEIVQAEYPLDLEALLSAGNTGFIVEMLNILDSTDRQRGSLKPGFVSRFRYRPQAGRAAAS